MATFLEALSALVLADLDGELLALLASIGAINSFFEVATTLVLAALCVFSHI